jgi:hypothetical protein
MKNYTLIVLLSIMTLVGCNQIINKADEIQHDYEFDQDISSTNKIVIKSKKQNETEGSQDKSSFEDNFLETKDLKQVKFFDSILNKIPKTNYCCCPYTNYSIAFYNNETIIDTYYADTLQFKDKVRIYEKSYQFSFIIEKETWKKFLSELNHKN